MIGAGNAPAVAVSMPPSIGRAGAGGAVPAPLAMELDRGVQLPAAMVQTADPMTPAQAAAKQQITDSFAREINKAAADSANDPSAVPIAWSKAQADANARYHLLYGDAAYNRASVAAGTEAVSP